MWIIILRKTRKKEEEENNYYYEYIGKKFICIESDEKSPIAFLIKVNTNGIPSPLRMGFEFLMNL